MERRTQKRNTLIGQGLTPQGVCPPNSPHAPVLIGAIFLQLVFFSFTATLKAQAAQDGASSSSPAEQAGEAGNAGQVGGSVDAGLAAVATAAGQVGLAAALAGSSAASFIAAGGNYGTEDSLKGDPKNGGFIPENSDVNSILSLLEQDDLAPELSKPVETLKRAKKALGEDKLRDLLEDPASHLSEKEKEKLEAFKQEGEETDLDTLASKQREDARYSGQISASGENFRAGSEARTRSGEDHPGEAKIWNREKLDPELQELFANFFGQMATETSTAASSRGSGAASKNAWEKTSRHDWSLFDVIHPYIRKLVQTQRIRDTHAKIFLQRKPAGKFMNKPF